ncbi:MAG: hypothetical protein V3V08_09425 [Nannocystaceae bacterium]
MKTMSTTALELLHGTDSKGQVYVEVECNGLPERLRVTRVPKTYGVETAGAALRIQLRDETGHLRQGPEFALDYLPGVIAALTAVGREGG